MATQNFTGFWRLKNTSSDVRWYNGVFLLAASWRGSNCFSVFAVCHSTTFRRWLSWVGKRSSSRSFIMVFPRNRSMDIPGGRRPWCCCHFRDWNNQIKMNSLSYRSHTALQSGIKHILTLHLPASLTIQTASALWSPVTCRGRSRINDPAGRGQVLGGVRNLRQGYLKQKNSSILDSSAKTLSAAKCLLVYHL